MIVSKSLNELHRLIDMKEATYTTPVRFYFSDGPKETTIGRLFIWEISGYLPEKEIDKKESAKIVSHINNNYTPEVAGRRLHKLQQFGFHKATMSGLSLCYDDTKFDFGIDFPAMTQELGKMGYEDRLAAADKVINECTDRWFKEVDRHNPLYAMGVSGARVSPPQVRSMVVAKGLLVGMTGKIMPMPIMENLSSGLSPINYFNTCGPARKGLAGNFFLVPATGWFARQLVNCSRELSIVEEDCGTKEVITLPKKSALYRFTSDRVMVTKENVDQLADEEGNVKVLSPITCESTKGGVCQHCCGMDPAKPANFFPINFGIGTASAQHISEPSTQAGLRGKHTSGSTTLKEFGTSVSNTLADILKTVGGRGTAVAQVSESKYKCITDLAHETGSAIKGAELASIQLKHIFDDIGIGIASIHHEIIARGCTDLVKMNNGRIGVRSMGDKGEVLAIKADAIPTKHPSWLKSIGHGNVKQRLTSAVLNGDVSFGTRSEMIIAGLNLNNK
ncbi:putative DNA-directed RNA polymerase beta' subunit [Escherichia phage vB_EcoM_IME392]|nr:putative DNA-directed RNA polymerase beta' subunit [Escherichia phage vB_EcoM_IME392]